MNETRLPSCRLCNYQSPDLEDIFSSAESNVEKKINKYLYLKVEKEDFSTKICWMCSNQIDTFHKFCEKINEIQKHILSDKYIDYVLYQYKNNNNNHEHILETSKFGVHEITVEPVVQIPYNELSEIEIIEDVPESSDCVTLINTPSLVKTTSSVDVASRPKRRIKKVLDKSQSQSSRQTRSKSSHSTNSKIQKISNLENSQDNAQGSSGSNVMNLDFVSNHSDHDLDEEEIDLDFKSIEITNIKSSNSSDMSDNTINVLKKGRGRPKVDKVKITQLQDHLEGNSTNEDDDEIDEELIIIRDEKIKRKKSSKNCTISNIEIVSPEYYNEEDFDEGEGESENEFPAPARDSDNEDWPAQETLNTFPDKILENGLLLVKGKKLMNMICKFYKLKCEICAKDNPSENQKPFKHLRHLLKHYADEHNEEGYVQCCQTKLSRYPAIIMHMARHIQPDAFKCDVCNYMVTRPRFLESHKQTHLPEDQKPYACDQCPRRFCWKGALQIHLISHQPADKRKLYVCHICGKVYDTPGGLSTHKKLIHSDRKNNESHVCHVCAKSFATRTGLNEHMSTIHQPREKDQVQCNECGKWLMNNRCLKSHMILHSTVELTCHLCSYSTKKHILLKRHLLTQHSDAKPFSCDICKKSFKLKRALTVHIAQHKNNKTYECPFCSRIFNSSTNFYTHRKNMHPRELQAMKEKDLEEQRMKRVRAGIEEDRPQEQIIITHTGAETDTYEIIHTSSGTILPNQTTYIIEETISTSQIIKEGGIDHTEGAVILNYDLK